MEANGRCKQNIHHIAKGAVLEQVWTGCQSRDIVRKDGTVALQASGKHFECHVCMVIEIDNQGKIVRIDEYYNKRWDEGRSKDRYVCMQD
jgi:ketosteroid isomerase-like protein